MTVKARWPGGESKTLTDEDGQFRLEVPDAPVTLRVEGKNIAAHERTLPPGESVDALRYRHIGNYRLDGTDATIRASGLDVIDLAVTKRLRRWMDFNLSADNLTNKVYYETQNYFESRVRPTDPIVARIHGTPGYPVGVTVGVTFHLFNK